MVFDSLFAKAESLLTYMVEHDYSSGYIRRIEVGIDWLRVNGEELQSYEDAYRKRTEDCSEKQKKSERVIFSLLQRFDEEGIYPDSKRRKALGDSAAINRLNEEYSEVIEVYKRAELARGLKPSAVHGFAGAGSRFLLAMQDMGYDRLSEITQAATLAFFTDESGSIKYSYAYQADIACVFKADLGIYSQDARRILSYFPRIRQRRKNIAYLKSWEVQKLHDLIDGHLENRLNTRDNAIAALLLFTGLRACDIAGLSLEAIDWNGDVIRMTQQKTGVPLELPLTATVGNTLYDYITQDRPKSDDSHVFLRLRQPHYPLSAGGIKDISNKIYDAASIRMNEGDRRGTHLFRYHAATALLGDGVSQPVISSILGHQGGEVLARYTSADLIHLRECALSISQFPVAESVFEI